MEQWRAELPRNKGTYHQGGFGRYTLCESCNNNTGWWYGREYVIWAHECMNRLLRIEPNANDALLHLPQRYPLRFLKQAVTMMFSANGGPFRTMNPELERFVLNKSQRCLPRQYDVYVTLIRPPFGRSAGVTGVVGPNGIEVVSEVAHPPMSIAVTFRSMRRDTLGCISHFGQYGYGDRADVWMCVRAGYAATPFPGDFRSPDEVERQASDAKE